MEDTYFSVLTIMRAKKKDRAVIGQRKTIVKSKDPASIADWPAVPTLFPRDTYVFGWPIKGQCGIFRFHNRLALTNYRSILLFCPQNG